MNRHNIIKENLRKCALTLVVLKLKFPSEIGHVTTEDTVVPLQKNSRRLNSKNKDRLEVVSASETNLYGFYQDDPLAIFITKSFLLRPLLSLESFVIKALTPTMLKEIPVHLIECDCHGPTHTGSIQKFSASHTVTWIQNDWAILEIIAHEAAHGGTSGHGLLWRKKYLKFLKTLFDLQISGQLKLSEGYTGNSISTLDVVSLEIQARGLEA